MTDSYNSRKGTKHTNNHEYWAGRLGKHGDLPGKFTKNRTSKKERREGKDEITEALDEQEEALSKLLSGEDDGLPGCDIFTWYEKNNL